MGETHHTRQRDVGICRSSTPDENGVHLRCVESSEDHRLRQYGRIEQGEVPTGNLCIRRGHVENLRRRAGQASSHTIPVRSRRRTHIHCLETPLTLLLSLIHISEPTRLLSISYAVFCLKKK